MELPQTRAFVDVRSAEWARAGTVSAWVGPVDGAAWLDHGSCDQHYAASTMKLALVMATFSESDSGRIDLGRSVPVRNSFRSVVGGRYSIEEGEDSDPEVWRRVGERVALRWLAYRAIVRSSNLATNLLLEAVGTAPVVALLAALGCSDSVFARGIEDYPARDAGHHNLVTPRDLATQLKNLAAGRVLTPSSTSEVLDVLAAQQVNDALPSRLPAGVRVAHKSGWVPGVSHDAGIVYPATGDPYVIVVCTTTTLSAQAALDLIADISAVVYQDVTAG